MTRGKEEDAGQTPPARQRAAEYVRMSTEHQKYSTENQQTIIRRYAAERGMTVVKTYADEGRSGLDLGGRAGLQRLLRDVTGGTADFSVILVLDVSRWGRFQDPDESAYYEQVCKRSGVRVEYCGEPFVNDGGTLATLVKTLKRTMAGEYSRDLSAKVFAGQCRLVELGFRQGGAPGFGLRRHLLAQDGSPKGLLDRGEHKSLQTDRVVLVPGPPDEVATVRWMYRAFIADGKTERAIAQALNERGVLTDFGRAWSQATVHQVLTNEKYVGDNVYNRTFSKLRQKRTPNAPETWVRAPGAFAPVIDRETFEAARAVIEARNRRFSDADMLERLTALWHRHGALSGFLIDNAEDMPSSSAYRARFGSLVGAYRLIGHTPARDYRYIEQNRFLRRLHADVVERVVVGIAQAGGTVAIDPDTDLLIVNGEFSVSLVVARALWTRAGRLYWKVRLDAGLHPDLTIVARMAGSNAEARDYFLLPRLDILAARLRVAEENGLYLDAYCVAALDALYELASRTPLRSVA